MWTLACTSLHACRCDCGVLRPNVVVVAVVVVAIVVNAVVFCCALLCVCV